MEREKYEKIRGLVSEIDDFSRSTDNVSAIFEKYQGDSEGEAKFFLHAEGENIISELPEELTTIICNDILNFYRNRIQKAKNDMIGIIDGLVDDGGERLRF